MSSSTSRATVDAVRQLRLFVLERYPFVLPSLEEALRQGSAGEASGQAGIESLRRSLPDLLRATLRRNVADPDAEVTPGVTAADRLSIAVEEVIDACDGCLRRAALKAGLTRAERIEILEGMILTRATDNRLKTFFTGGEVRYGDAPFQGKGFPIARPGSDLRRRYPAAPG